MAAGIQVSHEIFCTHCFGSRPGENVAFLPNSCFLLSCLVSFVSADLRPLKLSNFPTKLFPWEHSESFHQRVLEAQMLVDTSNPLNVGTHRTLEIPRENCGRSYQERQEPCIKLSLNIRLPDFDLKLHRTTPYPTKHVQTFLGHSMDLHSCVRAGCLLVRTFAWPLPAGD